MPAFAEKISAADRKILAAWVARHGQAGATTAPAPAPAKR
jgi:hypothetical protein